MGEAAAGVHGKDELVVGGENAVDEYAWGFEGTYVDAAGVSFPARLFVYKGNAKAAGEIEHASDKARIRRSVALAIAPFDPRGADRIADPSHPPPALD